MEAGTVCSQLTEDDLSPAEQENEGRFVAFRMSCHLVEGTSWCGE